MIADRPTFTNVLLAAFGEELHRHGVSHRRAARQMRIDHSTLSRWVNGNRAVRARHIDAIVEYLGRDRVAEILKAEANVDAIDRLLGLRR